MTDCSPAEIQVDSWQGFKDIANAPKEVPVLWRGQRDPKWKLQSLWDREIGWMGDSLSEDERIHDRFYRNGYKLNRDAYLKDFRKHARRWLTSGEAEQMSDDQWWALGRHFELLSPLLDWTDKPLVACFFAFADYVQWIYDIDTHGQNRPMHPYVCVYRLNCLPGLFSKEFRLVQGAARFNDRQAAQGGKFTHLDHGQHFDVESYLSHRKMAHCLTRYLLPTNLTSEVFNDLNRQGIHHASLFPDLFGAAKYANLRRYTDPQSFSQLQGQKEHRS